MLDDGWTDRWMNPGQSHLLAPDPGHSKEAPWWQVGRGLGSGGVVAQPPHGLGKTLGSRLSLDLAPGSTPPSCVPLGQWCKLSESCVHGRSQSPGHPLGPPEGSLFQAARSAFRFRLPPPTVGLHPARPQEAQGRSSEPSCRGRQTGHRYQGPRGQGEAGRRPHRTWWWGLGGSCRPRWCGGT